MSVLLCVLCTVKLLYIFGFVTFLAALLISALLRARRINKSILFGKDYVMTYSEYREP